MKRAVLAETEHGFDCRLEELAPKQAVRHGRSHYVALSYRKNAKNGEKFAVTLYLKATKERLETQFFGSLSDAQAQAKFYMRRKGLKVCRVRSSTTQHDR